MNVLLLNAGSSSLKAAVMAADDGATLAQGQGDWAGATTLYQFGDRKETVAWNRHGPAVERFVADLPPELRDSLEAVGHRIVHGGPFTSSVKITPAVRARILQLAELAPLHNPPSLEALAAAEAALPHLPHVAVFDTAFHATLPPEAFTYPVPALWTQEWGIRRFGFHGLSHAYCAGRAVEMLGTPVETSRIVICHLGHGCSASAVRGGKCVDTTMGFTPLDGLMMATRSGAIDPSIVLHVQQRHGLSPADVEAALNRSSGLFGVSGVSADMREILAAANTGNESARLALGIYTNRVRQAIGALAVTMGGLDALVFTAGVGEHAAEVRASVCRGLECLGLRLDLQANSDRKPDADLAQPDSAVRIFAIATREDVTMFREVRRALHELMH